MDSATKGLDYLTYERRKLNSKQNLSPLSLEILPYKHTYRTDSSSLQKLVAPGRSSGPWGPWSPAPAMLTPPCVSTDTMRALLAKPTDDSYISFTQISFGQPIQKDPTQTFLQPVHPEFYGDLGAVDLPGLNATSTKANMRVMARVLLVKEERHLASFPFRSSPGKPLETKETR